MSSSKDALSPAVQPLLVVLMGVSGTGKSTLAGAIAARSEFIFLDADNLHSNDAIAQMSRGVPLNDKQRDPWIRRIYRQLCDYQSANKNCILAYSGLKRRHRQVVFSAYKRSAGVLLRADEQLITERLISRRDHFMAPQLLSSQIADMEPFDEGAPLLSMDVTGSVEQLVAELEDFIGLLQKDSAI
ncbi:gluconokinase, GntK/IdnK-type [Porticoccaceae bacterium]|nr:gluconokinase, GntK/IdnK-type [Porticoccaceae bacterium]MDG2115561.1 gluconokinase, GntK/IdnK-type [Porticoccaceae bacterium]